jgi:hypothetical protein
MLQEHLGSGAPGEVEVLPWGNVERLRKSHQRDAKMKRNPSRGRRASSYEQKDSHRGLDGRSTLVKSLLCMPCTHFRPEA